MMRLILVSFFFLVSSLFSIDAFSASGCHSPGGQSNSYPRTIWFYINTGATCANGAGIIYEYIHKPNGTAAADAYCSSQFGSGSTFDGIESCTVPIQCEAGYSPNESNTECVFTGCPSGYVQFGNMCKTLPEPEGEGQYFCDNDGCSWVEFDDLPFVDISCTVKSKNYLGHFNGVAKCAYIDGEAYDQEDIDNPNAAGAGSCGAGYSEQYINDNLYCIAGNESVSPDLPVCTPPKIGVNGGCEYPPYYNSQETQQGIIIGEDGTEKEYIVNQNVSTDRYGNSTTTFERLESICDYVDNVRICSDFELVESSVIDDSDSERSSVSGGDSCSSPYSCSGDAVQCASLAELHAIRCASAFEFDSDLPDHQPNTDWIDDYDFSGLDSDLSTGVENSLDSLPSKYDTLANKYGGESDLVTNVDLSEFVYDDVQLVTGTCPASFDFELGVFGVVAFDMTPFCTFLGYISYLVRLSASLFALRLTLATVSKL